MPRPKINKDIQFFGEIDMAEGRPRSNMPAWYFDAHIAELNESIEQKKMQIDRGLVDPDVSLRMQEEIKYEKAKLEAIRKGRPNLSGEQKDRCYNEYKSLEQQIKDTMPTRKEDKLGLVSPQEELKRMKSKHIKVDPEIALACGCKPIGGKVSGDEANTMYKMIGKTLGENTNVERVRRDGGGESYKTIESFVQAILAGKEVKV